MPRGALSGLSVGAGRNQPTLHDFLQEAVLHQALAVNSAQVVGTEHMSVALLEFLERVEGFGELFVWRGHERLPSSRVITSLLWRINTSIFCRLLASQLCRGNASILCFDIAKLLFVQLVADAVFSPSFRSALSEERARDLSRQT